MDHVYRHEIIKLQEQVNAVSKALNAYQDSDLVSLVNAVVARTQHAEKLLTMAQWDEGSSMCPWCASEYWTGHDEDCPAAMFMDWRMHEVGESDE